MWLGYNAPVRYFGVSSRRFKSALLCVGMGLGIVLSSACSFSGRSRVPQDLSKPAPTPVVAEAVVPPAPPDATRGAKIYEQKCAACHGAAGDGNGPQAAAIRAQGKQVANLIDPAKNRAVKPSDWYQVVSNGRLQNLMPLFSGSLKPQERWDVLAYTWALGTRPNNISAGKTLFEAQCVQCHTTASLGKPEILARSALNDTLAAMAKGEHHRANAQLTEAQRGYLTDYVRSLAYQYADPVAIKDAALKGDGILAWQVSNQTPGARLQPNLPVTLHVYDATSEVFTRTAVTSDNGLAQFSQLPARRDYFYEPEIVYNGARFFGAPAQITTTNLAPRPFAIYEVTNDASVISISDFHYFVQDADEGKLSIAEVYSVDNRSDRAYVAKTLQSLRFALPSDATNIRFDGPGIGARFMRDGDILIDMDAVIPGARASSLTLIYDIPYRNNKIIEREMFYPLQKWDVVLPSKELRATGAGLVDRGPQQVQNTTFNLFVADKGLVAAGKIRFELIGQPRAAAVPGSDNLSIGIGVGLLVLSLGLLYLAVLRGRVLRAGGSPAISGDKVVRQALLQAVADLDDDFEAGKLAEADYHQQREALLSHLAPLKKGKNK